MMMISQLALNFMMITVKGHYLQRRMVTQCDVLNDQILMTGDSQWEPSERFNGRSEYFQKRDCEFGRVWDVMFCTRVCELQEGDICNPSVNPGLDMCREDLECVRNNDLPDNLGVCEQIVPIDLDLDYNFYDLMESMLN
ncbi:Oidioi.mRNA.OKI2018_I69.PAR.g8999.t1.cds [Oikopleura dioica]|uniref:Oidioi.mRNA.OKI2018_I69.PAR.g8999.t1.cds n=1 Tax=Oikopleura dioica TaxID=34765 RepID=A0ABN7RIK1_OIKDI|nr:Oidioi.mRNA.OKI2018_I69.PAR.g8999.t1.cds [Oikopleura dioica]